MDTYVSISGWDCGCDDCGACDNFETERRAEEWADNHVCESQDG